MTSGSPAEEAGLVADGAGNDEASGDVITAVDGNDVASVEEIVKHLNSLAPGDSVSLTLLRDGETIEVNVELGEWPSMSN